MGKKVKENKIKYQTEEQQEIKKFLVIILVVAVCVAGIYFLTRAFVTKDLFDDGKNNKEVVKGEVNYDVAIIGNMLNRPYDTYYVAIYNTEGEYASDMSTIVSAYKSKEQHLHIFTVDLANTINSEYYTEEQVDTTVKDLTNLKVGDITLIKVKDGQIVKFIVDLSKMNSELGV